VTLLDLLQDYLKNEGNFLRENLLQEKSFDIRPQKTILRLASTSWEARIEKREIQTKDWSDEID